MVVIALGKNLLFKSVLAHCVLFDLFDMVSDIFTIKMDDTFESFVHIYDLHMHEKVNTVTYFFELTIKKIIIGIKLLVAICCFSDRKSVVILMEFQ